MGTIHFFLVSAAFLGAEEKTDMSSHLLENVQEEIRRSEYAFKRISDGAWAAPNRAQDLRSRIRGGALEVTSRTRGAEAWNLTLRLRGVGRSRAIASLEEAEPHVRGSRLDLVRPDLLETYWNDERGLEQELLIAVRPEGAACEPIVLDLEWDGSVSATEEGNRSVLFTDAKGAGALRYGDLKVLDARGRELPSKVMVEPCSLKIEIDDGDARYPILVDPLLSSPNWTAEGNQAGAGFGLPVTTAGDVNGDGFSDVLVGANSYDAGQVDEGRAFLFLGSASGLSPTAAWTAEGNQAQAYFGQALATAGDVNGDGYDDVLVSAYAFDNGQTDEGRVYLYMGSASGLSASPSWTLEGNNDFGWLGISLSPAGDVNDDGYSDVLVTQHGYDGDIMDEGRVLLFHGSSSGLSTTPDWSVEGGQAQSSFGQDASTAGDVNADGFLDVIVGATYYDHGEFDEGAAFVYLGWTVGLDTSPTWTLECNQEYARFGFSVANAGDVNGDGYGDVIVGAYGYDGGQIDEGTAFVYLGSDQGVPAVASWRFESDQAGASLGWSVATAGDLNGDGYSDIVVGAPNYDGGQMDEGRAFVFFGSSDDFLLYDLVGVEIEGNQAGAALGTSVGTAGDMNGDGFSDLCVGAPGYDNPQANEGGAFVYYGSAVSEFSYGIPIDGGIRQQDAAFGYSVASAGDVNGDGYGDVIIGSKNHSNGEADEGRAVLYLGKAFGINSSPAWTAEGNQASAYFGGSVSSAGDINGDGFCDVIVGAFGFDSQTKTDVGRASVYLGSPAGLEASTAWMIEGAQTGEMLGKVVAFAGDVNGDGFCDLIIGADEYSNTHPMAGRVVVFHGPDLGPTPAWTQEGGQESEYLGFSVSGAGDVNCDGFSDVIIGSQGENGEKDEGQAVVYLGSSTGLGTSPAWRKEGNQAFAFFGWSVGTAGDVNGDGYSDVIIGAPYFDNGQTNEGKVFVYQGSSAGLRATPSWTAEGYQAECQFGWSVSTAVDVNGDGFSDVIVGAPMFDVEGSSDWGMFFIYHGSTSGLPASADWTWLGSDRDGGHGGSCVASAGDVNGDGFGDVIIGAPEYNDLWGGPENVYFGKAFLYTGNTILGSVCGLDRCVQQFQPPTSYFHEANVGPLGMSYFYDSFQLVVIGRSPSGRGKVRLEWEVKPLGTTFNGTGLGIGPWTDTGPPKFWGNAVQLSDVVHGLTKNTAYHWRLRIASKDPALPHTPWFSPPWNCSTESDIRTNDIEGIHRGDVDGNKVIDITDAVFVLRWRYRNGSPPPCSSIDPCNGFDSINVNGDTKYDYTDSIYLMQWLFMGGKPILHEILTCCWPSPPSPQLGQFSLDFDGVPQIISGSPGEKKVIDVFCTLTMSAMKSEFGPEAWSLSLSADGGNIDAIDLNGISVHTIYYEDPDYDPGTPPIIHEDYTQELGGSDMLSRIADTASLPPHHTKKGAISAVIFRGTELMALPPSGTVNIARLTISTTLPQEGCVLLTLRYEDGMCSDMSQPVSNVVTVQGTSQVPQLGSRTIMVCTSADVQFRRGDANADGLTDISDGVAILNYLFLGVKKVPCEQAGDTNDDGTLDISDGVYVLSFLFLGGKPIAPPVGTCGVDPTMHGLPCDSFQGCQ
jgi:hypothetical protein